MWNTERRGTINKCGTDRGNLERLCVEGTDLQVQKHIVHKLDDAEGKEERGEDEQHDDEPVHPVTAPSTVLGITQH